MANAKVAEIYVQLRADLAEYKKTLADANVLTKQWSGTMREETQKSREAIRLLNEDLGVHLPRGLQNVISKMPMVTAAMNAAFDAVVVITLIRSVVEVGEKIYEFARKSEEAAQKHREAWASTITPINDTNDKLELTKTKLENAIAKLEHKPQNKIKEAIEEATVAADELGRHLDADIKKIAESLKGEQSNAWSQTLLHQTGGTSAATIAGDAQDKFNQISAGTYKGTGDQTKDRDAVIQQAINAAYTKLTPAQKLLDEVTANNGGRVPANSSSAVDVRTLTELIAGLKGMQTTSSLTQAVATDQGQLGILQGNKTTSDAARKARGEMVDSMVKDNEDRAKEQKRIAEEVEAYGVKLLEQGQAAQLASDKKEEESDKHKADVFKADVASQIQAQRDLIAEAGKRYQDVDRASKERVRGGLETEGQRSQELAQAAGAEADAKTAAYKAIADLLFSVGKGTSSEAVKAGDDAIEAEREGQQKIYDIHAQYADEIRQKWLNALSGINHELANMLTGQRTNWSGMFRGEATHQIEGGLRKAESAIFGTGKSDGSKESPWWVKFADKIDGQGGVGGAGADAIGGAGKGILGILNDSNWFSSLFGGKLFGSGSLFGGHALGGPALAGVPIPVGELGPETFVPSVPGTVVPHGQGGFGGGNTWIIDAKGTDPSLTRENFQRALQATHAQAVSDSARISADRARRQPR